MEQAPRPRLRVPPSLVRGRPGGFVRLKFLVDESGRVIDPKVDSSTDPALETAALNAIRQWRFEPGRRDGKAVPWHVSQQIQFPDSR